jgi:N-acetylglucosamine kinase-like BadF-type ATPase
MALLPDVTLFLGLDAGGTKTELLSDGTPPIHLQGPGANPRRIGFAESAHVLTDLIHQALAQHPDAATVYACAGVSGAGRTEAQAELLAAVQARLDPRVRFLLRHDSEVALEGAFEGGSGVIVIAGTGSVVFGRTRAGRTERVGGWGYLLGDEGSGFRLGQRGLQAVVAMIDGGPATTLREALAARFELATPQALIQAVYSDHWPLQQMAPVVLEAAAANDAVARHLVAEETNALVRSVGWLVRRVPDLEPRLALQGGLSHNAFYQTAFAEALAHKLPDWTLMAPLHTPAEGALRLAMQAGE